MDRLLESYKTLMHLGSQVLYFIEIYETFTEKSDYLDKVKLKKPYGNQPFSKAISGSLMNYSLIISCSFIDEYNEEFTSSKHPELANRINRLKKITKPVMKRLNMWTNFKEYRNTILAHNFRINGKSLFAKNTKPFHFNTPHTNSEIVLLGELLKVITTCITQEFHELFEQLDWTENVLTKTNFNYPAIDINKEITTIWEQINSIKTLLP